MSDLIARLFIIGLTAALSAGLALLVVELNSTTFTDVVEALQ